MTTSTHESPFISIDMVEHAAAWISHARTVVANEDDLAKMEQIAAFASSDEEAEKAEKAHVFDYDDVHMEKKYGILGRAFFFMNDPTRERALFNSLYVHLPKQFGAYWTDKARSEYGYG